MFSWLKSKSEKEKLQKEYQKVMEKAFKVSKISREESDQLYTKAKEIEDKILALENSVSG